MQLQSFKSIVTHCRVVRENAVVLRGRIVFSLKTLNLCTFSIKNSLSVDRFQPEHEKLQE